MAPSSETLKIRTTALEPSGAPADIKPQNYKPTRPGNKAANNYLYKEKSLRSAAKYAAEKKLRQGKNSANYVYFMTKVINSELGRQENMT